MQVSVSILQTWEPEGFVRLVPLRPHNLVYAKMKTMKRMDLYIKVEVELEEGEKPEKVANEICRVVQKLYPVRSAELSSAVVKE
jgi:hypothetical protein